MFPRWLASIPLLLVVSATVSATTIRVPGDSPTIQCAIDAAANGDLVLVEPGTYNESLNFRGKAITVRSTAGPEVTVIQGDSSSPVVSFQNGEGPDSVLEGFTITSGWHGVASGFGSPVIRGNIIRHNHSYKDGSGGGALISGSATLIENVIFGNANNGIKCTGSAWIENNEIHGNTADGLGGGGILCEGSCTIRGNFIHDNDSSSGGGGIYLRGAGARVTGNLIMENRAGSVGGGIACFNTSPLLTNNTIRGNHAELYGGGVSLVLGSAEITNNVIIGNDAAGSFGGGGLYSDEAGAVTIANTILWENTPNEILVEDGPLAISYSDVKGGLASVHVSGNGRVSWGNGMIDADPRFVNAAVGDFHLRSGSSCVDAGDNGSPLPQTDDEGDPRILDGDGDGVPGVDIGADELRTSHVARFGTVNAAGDALTNVLRVNGSAGDRWRVCEIPTGTALEVTLVPSAAGPDPALFVVYAWPGEPDASTLSAQPRGLGFMSFPTHLSAGLPKPARAWNNLGHPNFLGDADFPSTPAPSILASDPSGRSHPVTVTLQGFILDAGSAAECGASITNAIILKIIDRANEG